jgi:hypothetical protein
MGLALGAVIVGLFAIFDRSDNTHVVVAKFIVSAALGGLAAYTARQSGRHREREERARNLQLELTAFGPFIEPLDKDQQDWELTWIP